MLRRLRARVRAFFDWMDAKYWAKEWHPAWVQMATQARHPETRAYYRAKIVAEWSRDPYENEKTESGLLEED